MATIAELAQVLATKTGFEVLEADEKTKQLRLMGRLHKNFSDHWKLVMHRLLSRETTTAWKIDISKKYFLRTNQVYYGWRLLLQGENVTQYYEDVIRTIQATPPPSTITVEEIPLQGSATNRNTRTNVGSVGNVAIGPMAAIRKMQGG